MTRHLRILTVGLCIRLCACDGRSEQTITEPAGALPETGPPGRGAARPQGWGAMLLGLIPERGDQSVPSVARVREALGECVAEQPGPAAGRCDLLGRAPSAPGAPSVGVQIDRAGSNAAAVRLSACCSSDPNFFRPIQDAPVVRTELMCPEMTIVSSDTVQAFRVSSPGKRDFVYAKGSRTTAAGGRIDLTILLSPVDQSDECSTLAEAHAKITGQD